MSSHRILDETFDLTPGLLIEVGGEEAHHAVKSKRLAAGDSVGLLDGRGRVATARIEGVEKAGKGDWRLRLAVGEVEQAEPVRPWLEIVAAAPKGPRLEGMIDQLSQAGASSWRPLASDRVVVDPREGKLDRMGRVAKEAAKQCGRAYLMAIGGRMTLARALAAPDEDGAKARVLIADAGGAPISKALAGEPGGSVRVLVGPEGGWTDEERALAIAGGATAVGLGPHVLRTETAAVVAAALVRAATGA